MAPRIGLNFGHKLMIDFFTWKISFYLNKVFVLKFLCAVSHAMGIELIV